MVPTRIQHILIGVSAVALLLFFYNLYTSHQFKANPLPQRYIEQIEAVEQDVLKHMQKNFGYRIKFPLIITDKIPGKIYGVTSKDKQGNVTVYLNKKIMKESFEYILSDVIAHEPKPNPSRPP